MAKYGLTPAQYPDFAALRGDPSDNLPSIPGVGEKTASKWITQFGSLDALVDRVDEVPGKAGAALREHLASVVRNRQLTELLRDVELPVGPHDLRLGTLGSRGGAPAVRHAAVPGACGSGCTRRCRPSSPKPIRASTSTCESLGAGEMAQWLAEHAQTGERSGLAFRGTWGRGTGTLPGVAIAAADGAAAWVDPTRLGAEDEAALAGLARRPGSAQGGARRQGPAARARRARADPGRRHQRHRAGGLPRAAGPAFLRPRRSRAALPAPGAARRVGRGGRPTGSSPSTAAARTGRSRRGRAAGPGRARSGRSPWSRTSSAAAAPGCCARSSCRWSACSRTWNGSGSPPTPSISSGSQPRTARR